MFVRTTISKMRSNPIVKNTLLRLRTVFYFALQLLLEIAKLLEENKANDFSISHILFTENSL